MWRLKNRGFVKSEKHKWFITQREIEYLKLIKNRINKYKQLFDRKIDREKKIIIIFDIPKI